MHCCNSTVAIDDLYPCKFFDQLQRSVGTLVAGKMLSSALLYTSKVTYSVHPCLSIGDVLHHIRVPGVTLGLKVYFVYTYRLVIGLDTCSKYDGTRSPWNAVTITHDHWRISDS